MYSVHVYKYIILKYHILYNIMDSQYFIFKDTYV